MSNTPSLYTAPVGFSQPMMAANLAGRKFQTRRLPSASGTGPWGRLCYAFEVEKRPCVLWVKERADKAPGGERGFYTIDSTAINEPWPFKTSFVTHLPRTWSRFVCVVKGVRYEPLHDVSEEDAKAEGIYSGRSNDWAYGWTFDGGFSPNPRTAYARLWDLLHTKPGQRWDDNPMVWVIEYEWRAQRVEDLLKDAAHG